MPTDDERVRATVRGIRRVVGTGPTKKTPATAERIMAMVPVSGAFLAGLQDRALLLLGRVSQHLQVGKRFRHLSELGNIMDDFANPAELPDELGRHRGSHRRGLIGWSNSRLCFRGSPLIKFVSEPL